MTRTQGAYPQAAVGQRLRTGRLRSAAVQSRRTDGAASQPDTAEPDFTAVADDLALGLRLLIERTAGEYAHHNLDRLAIEQAVGGLRRLVTALRTRPVCKRSSSSCTPWPSNAAKRRPTTSAG
ncbi:hypothetical protein [Streptomyces albicerus]|uniref:hypothetical protein n=1 Tax=Streptomyces albicerus TaxID=2569859 RepID=UPI00124B9CA2|nr:hypothetical protein [Streptomyces albicerus]